jgi:hypothetical protein
MPWVQVRWAVVFTPWRYAGVCVLDAYYPAGSLPRRTPYPPASFSFLSSPSFALSAGHSAILGNDAALWGRNGAGGRAACPPRARRTWAAYAPGVRGVVVRNSAVCRCPPHLALLWTMLLEHAGRCHLTSHLSLSPFVSILPITFLAPLDGAW